MRFISDDTEANRRIDMRSFTARDVQLILSNPVYVGIGKYERIIHDDKWIQTALRAGLRKWRVLLVRRSNERD